MTVRVPMLNTDTDSAETFRLALGGIWAPASALNARTGVTSVPTLTGTGNLTATISPFTGVIDGTSGALQGCYPVALDTTTTVTITAGNTQARIDLICLQVSDTDYDGSGLRQCVPVVVAGVPSGSPVAPTTPANAIPLWTIPVPALATSLTWSTATAVFPYTAANGAVVPVRNAGDKPAAVNGLGLRWRLDVTAAAGSTSPLEASVDGVTYKPIFDASAVPATTTSAINTAISNLYGSWISLTVASGWSAGFSTPQYRTAPQSSIQLSGSFQVASSLVAGTYTIVTGLPAAATPSAARWIPVSCDVTATAQFTGHINITTGGNITLYLPATLAAGRYITLDGVQYQK